MTLNMTNLLRIRQWEHLGHLTLCVFNTNTSLKIRTSPLCIQNKNIIHNSPQQSITAH